MALDERPAVTDPLEERLRRRLWAVTGWVFLGLIVVLALADTFGSREDIHASPAVFGGLLASYLVILGVRNAPSIAGFLGIGNGNGKH